MDNEGSNNGSGSRWTHQRYLEKNEKMQDAKLVEGEEESLNSPIILRSNKINGDRYCGRRKVNKRK